MTTETEELPSHIRPINGEKLKTIEAFGDPLVGLLKAHPVQMSMDLLTYITASIWVDVRIKVDADRIVQFEKWVECVRRTIVDTRAAMKETGHEEQD